MVSAVTSRKVPGRELNNKQGSLLPRETCLLTVDSPYVCLSRCSSRSGGPEQHLLSIEMMKLKLLQQRRASALIALQALLNEFHIINRNVLTQEV